MKKLGPIILGFIIGAVLTYYFCPRPIEEASAPTTLVEDKGAPKDTITVAEAIKLSNNWANSNATEIDPLIEVEGSKKKMRSVKWTLDEVKEYLTYAEAKSHTLGYKMTGLKVYLGNYGKNGKLGKKNRNTMFIVPTGHKSTSKASSLNLNILTAAEDIPAPPLNNGNGGEGGYPQ